MATSLITRETTGGGATVKNAPLTNTEVDNNFISLADNKVEIIEGTVAVIPTGTTAERPSTPSEGMLRFNTTESVFEGYDGTEWGSIGGGGVSYTFHTSNYTADAGEGILADTTGGSFTVTLPASPDVGDTVVIADAGGAWGTNNLTIARNGSTIEDSAEDLIGDIDSVSVTLIYDGTTWETFSQVGALSSEVLVNSDIGVTVQGFDADTAKYDDTTANFTGTLQNNGSNVVVDSDIGSTVQAFDANTAKLDVAQTYTARQDFDTVKAETYEETKVDVTSSSTTDLDLSTATVFNLSLGTNITTFNWNNVPTTGTAYGFTLKVVQSGSFTIAWPAAVVWEAATAPTLTGSGATDIFTFFTHDGGTTWYGFTAGQEMS